MIRHIVLGACLASLSMASLAASLIGDAAAGEKKAEVCAACHGVDGNSTNPSYPNLAAQVPGYIADQLAQFKSGERENALMAGITAGLSEQDMADLDAFYIHQVPRPGAVPKEELDAARRGERLYRGGYAPMKVAACMSCHGPQGHGVPRRFPRVSGQNREYLKSQLWAFKSGKRSGFRSIMSKIAFRMSEQQIDDVTVYMHGLK